MDIEDIKLTRAFDGDFYITLRKSPAWTWRGEIGRFAREDWPTYYKTAEAALLDYFSYEIPTDNPSFS